MRPGAARELRLLLRAERANGGVPMRPGLLARGFVSQRAALYPFDRWHPRWFLTDLEIEARLGRVNPAFPAGILSDKVYFHLFNRALDQPLPMPEPVGVALRGTFRPLCGAGLEAALERAGRVVVKPAMGAGGRGVRIVSRAEDALSAEVAALVELPVPAHDYARAIFPDALNTIRIVTFREDGAAPFVAAAAHRFGTARTAPIDGFKAGGLSALVDPATGRLSAGRSNPGRFAESRHPRHPETGAPIEGVAVAHWPEALALALRAAAVVPGLRMAGWDVAIAPDGPVLVEGNARVPNPNLIQAHRPLLTDPRVRHFLGAHGVLSPRRLRRLEEAARAGGDRPAETPRAAGA